MFDIRMMRPLHGWRALLGEIGIVVAGVLIALGAEQLTQRWRSGQQVTEAKAALAVDVVTTFALTQERELYARCIARRLRDIAGILDAAQKSGRLPPVGLIGQPSERVYDPGNWQALTGAGLASQFSRKDLLGYSGIAMAGAALTRLNRDEMIVWADLHAIVGPGRPIAPDEIGRLYATLSRAGYYAKAMRLWADAARQNIREADVPLDEDGLADFRKTWPQTRRKVAHRHICRPLDPAPDAYGQAPYDNYSLEGPAGG